jgi:radical SAM protein with 4Fe4S-binding SPASM domain
MISISRLLCDNIGPGDHLRYEKRDVPRPVVVWNFTRQCNLNCVHCYASANRQKSLKEMDTGAGIDFIKDLAAFGAPVILFSGGEPLMRKDLFQLAEFARNQGLRVAISTNGTLITPSIAAKLSDIGFAEIGISLDGINGNNDRFRGKDGAYQSALTGIRNCVKLGLRVSLRLTMTAHNHHEIPAILQLTEDENINRMCFYHLAYSGRGGALQKEDITHEETRHALDIICSTTLDMYKRGLHKEVLTVGSHTDGVYLYLKLKKQDPARAEKVMELLSINGGNSSGMKISAVDDLGNVHPDQFWWHYSLGNVLERKFSEIWSDSTEPLLHGLRERKKLLTGRCGQCKYLSICNGNLRVRAEAVYGDVWAPDPACYLTDEEIGIK